MQRELWLRFDADAVVHGSANPLFAAQVAFGCLHGNMPEKELNLLQFSLGGMAQLSARATQIMRSEAGNAELVRVVFHHVPHNTFGYAVTPGLPARQTHRNNLPADIPAAATHRSIVALTHSGTGTVRMWPPLPTRSTMAQCSSCCCKCAKSRSANSRLRSPQPSNIARIARSRFPLSVFGAGDCQKRRASSAVSQFPSLVPNFLAPLTRRIPAASSGLSKPASAAS